MKRRRRQRLLRREEISIRGEVEYVVRRAARGEARVVGLGPLVFFSSETGDAWMLDPAEGRALPIARDGEPLPSRIVETEVSFCVEWTHEYRIEGDRFVTKESESRRVVTIIGYAIEDIARECTSRVRR